MKRLFAFALSLGLVAAMAVPVMAEGNAVTPSTNDINRTDGMAHFNVTGFGVGYANVTFVSTQAWHSCFEYRTDGDQSQSTGDNPNGDITDGFYPYTCKSNSTGTMTIDAHEYIEIRMVFGAETDEPFDWTRVDVLAPADASEKMDCKNGGWEEYDFDNQGQCVRYITSGKDSRP